MSLTKWPVGLMISRKNSMNRILISATILIDIVVAGEVKV